MKAIRFAVRAASLTLLCAAGLSRFTPAALGAEPQQGGTAQAKPPANSAKPPEFTSPAPSDPAKLGQPAAKPEPVTAEGGYVIGAEDLLGISVWGDPRLSGAFVVRPDGRISVPLAGEVMAAGLSPMQLGTAIANLLKQKDILLKPEVTVQVNQINSRKYFIQGEVLKPGSNPLVVPTTILEALVNAGGFKEFANMKKIEIIRGNERFRFNYKDVIKGKHTEQNILLKPGDIIIVP